MLDMTPDTQPPDTKRFLRTKDDRYLAGVGGGLGRAFGVDPIIFRILLGALVFAGGLGLFLYLLVLVFVPSDDGTGQAAPRGSSDTLRRLVAVSALVIGGLAAASVLFWGAAWVTAIGGGSAVAACVLLLGVALVVGAVRGDRRARWLVLPAVLLAFPATVVAAADIDLGGGTGERRYRPTGTEELPREYRLGAGELVVDLRGLDWSGGRQERLAIDVSVGHALVIVPDEVCVSARSRVTVGHSDVLGRVSDGLDIDQRIPRSPRPGGAGLSLDATMSAGGFEVLHRDPQVPAFPEPSVAQERRATDRACAGAGR